MSNAPHARPRRIATVGRITVVVGSGIALGALSAHVQSEALAKADSDGTTPAVQDVKPQVVTIVREKHVSSEPVIVYRQAPSEDDDTSEYKPRHHVQPQPRDVALATAGTRSGACRKPAGGDVDRVMTGVRAADRRAMTDVRVTDDHVTVSIRRWRSRLSLTVRSREPLAAADICEQLLSEQVDALERIVSRFRADSQLSAVNRRAGNWTPVSWSFVTLLTAGILAAERTDGLVDPCLGTLVDAAGYRRWRDGIETRRLNLVTDTPVSPHAAPEPVEFPAVPIATPYWQRIEVRPGLGGAQVRIPKGCQLDLGAIAKAWLADHLATRLVDGWSFDAIANMGGDIRAVGLSRPWTIAADPQLDGWELLALTVTDSGLATSGQGLRRWTTPSGEIGHHIIDPRTGRPAATPWWTASVLAADARDANTASTAAMVLGHSATDWLTAHGLDAWLVPAPGRDRREARVLGRWPESKEPIR